MDYEDLGMSSVQHNKVNILDFRAVQFCHSASGAKVTIDNADEHGRDPRKPHSQSRHGLHLAAKW